jgi:hypothetical protein
MTYNPVHTYANAGMYMVCLTIYDSISQCQSSFCDTVTITISGITERTAGPKWNLHPVPATTEIFLTGDEELRGASWIILDITGRQVSSGRNEGSAIPVASLENGAYILQVINSKGEASSRRFIKE